MSDARVQREVSRTGPDQKVFEFRVPLEWLRAPMANQGLQADRLGLRVSIWHDRLPVDALPVEGSIELQLVSEAE